MKRKIFTFIAALAVTAATVLPVSAAAKTCHGTADICTRPAYICQPGCGSSCPTHTQKPEIEQKPEIQMNSMSQLEQTAAELVNDKREANGLEPLEISANLSAKARVKAQDMKKNNYFNHTSPVYGSPFAMMQSLGITYRSAAENIAMGYRTAQAVVNAWMASPSHRANILSTRYDTMGIGFADGYWAQWFIR